MSCGPAMPWSNVGWLRERVRPYQTHQWGKQLMAPTITTGPKPLSLGVFHLILQPSFIQQLHRVTFPIKPELFCSLSERPQQCWRRHYNTWAGQCQLPQQSLPRDHGALCAHLGALSTLLKEIHANNPWQEEGTIRSVPGWPQSQY